MKLGSVKHGSPKVTIRPGQIQRISRRTHTKVDGGQHIVVPSQNGDGGVDGDYGNDDTGASPEYNIAIILRTTMTAPVPTKSSEKVE
jgi:hypothetical protein